MNLPYIIDGKRASKRVLETCMLCSFCLLICQSTCHVLASLSPPTHTGDTVVTQSNTCALYLGRSLKIDDDACFIHNHCVLDQVISLSRLQHMHAHTHTHTHTHTTQKYTHAHATNHTRSHTNTHKQTHTHTCIIYTYHIGHIWWIRRALFAFTHMCDLTQLKDLCNESRLYTPTISVSFGRYVGIFLQ